VRYSSASRFTRHAHFTTIAARKEIYERVHPETRVGATGRKGRKICDDTDRFTKDTAAKTGRSERSVQLDAKRGKQLRIKETIGTSLKTHAPRHDESIALQQTQAELKQSQAEVERLNRELDTWNRSASDGALETPAAVIATLIAILAKAQIENFWGDVSKESIKKLIENLSAAVASTQTIKNCLKAKVNTATVH